MPLKKDKYYTIALIAILVMTFALRIYGISFGLPYSYHNDEDRLVHHALAFGMGDLNPHYFNYPSFLMYLLFAFYAAFYALGYVFGYFASTADFAMLHLSDPSTFYIIGRMISVVLGAATVFLVYLIGRRLYSKTAGLVAALVLSVTCAHVLSSHYITTDVPMTFFIMATAFFSVRIMEEGRWKDYILAAVMTGFATGCKYNGILACVLIVIAHLVRATGVRAKVKSLFNRRLIASAAVVLVTLFCISPYCFLDFSAFLADFNFNSEHVRSGVYGLSAGVQWHRYFLMLFTDLPYSWPYHVANTAGVVMLGGIFYAICKHGKKEAITGIFPIVFFLIIGSWSVVNRRYLIPILPFCSILAGAAIHSMSARWNRYRYAHAVVWVSLAALLIIPARNSLLSSYMMSQQDTRTIARQWIEHNIPEGSKIALEWDSNVTVPLEESSGDILKKIEAYENGETETVHFSEEQMVEIHRMRLKYRRGREYEVVRIGRVEGTEIIPHLYDISELRKQSVEYVVVSGDISIMFQEKLGVDTYPTQAKFYQDLKREASVIQTFQPEKGKTPGPVLTIYRLKSITELSFSRVNKK